jgi:osmotically-inducible protein OsmY
MEPLKRYSYLFFSIICFLLFISEGTFAQSANLVSKVESALNRYYMDPFNIKADENGKVTIKGDVNTLYDKLNIFDIVAAVKGVKEIADEVIVDTPLMPDSIIADDIEDAIQNNSIILEPDKINVKVDEGVVFLDGTVSYYKEKLAAETIASQQDGVKGIENDINVLPPKQERSDENIKSILNEILINKFPMVKNNVNITVNNGDVVLSGEVQSLWEKSNLQKEFLQVLGVKSVTENLKINYSEPN